MTLLEYAGTELTLAADETDDHLVAGDPRMTAAILELVAAFGAQGHSGGSAPMGAAIVLDTIRRLLDFEPLGPLTGADDEWVTIDGLPARHPVTQQNRRCATVFRELHDGQWIAYALDRVIWTDRPRGDAGFTSGDSSRRITFPWSPTAPRRRWKAWRPLITTAARLRGTLRP